MARVKSDTADIIACVRITACLASRLRHPPSPELSQTERTGWHCMIHMTVRTVLENMRKPIAQYNMRRRAQLRDMRRRKRQMEIFVHMSVKKVWIHSPYVYLRYSRS